MVWERERMGWSCSFWLLRMKCVRGERASVGGQGGGPFAPLAEELDRSGVHVGRKSTCLIGVPWERSLLCGLPGFWDLPPPLHTQGLGPV